MKLIRLDRNRRVFLLGRREKGLLTEILELYPLVPDASEHHRVSIKGTGQDEHQRLLDEALATHRNESRRQVRAWLDEPNQFKESKAGYQVALSPSQMEWLLQMLNDIRVGSWIALGSPDTEKGERISVNPQTAPSLRVMELAGHFEAALLEAMGAE